MAKYVDGFIVPVKKKNIKKYKNFALKWGKIWKKYGALEYIECQADEVKKGKVTSFPRSVKLKGNETVFFSWIVYKSKAHRNQIFKKVMKDPNVNMENPHDWPFDGMRMIYGGFKPVVTL